MTGIQISNINVILLSVVRVETKRFVWLLILSSHTLQMYMDSGLVLREINHLGLVFNACSADCRVRKYKHYCIKVSFSATTGSVIGRMRVGIY